MLDGTAVRPLEAVQDVHIRLLRLPAALPGSSYSPFMKAGKGIKSTVWLAADGPFTGFGQNIQDVRAKPEGSPITSFQFTCAV